MTVSLSTNNYELDLQQKYLRLVNVILPGVAREKSFPITFNHCFARIILDNLFEGCWYNYLDPRGRVAAYKQLDTTKLSKAISLAESMAEGDANHITELNKNSLRWRKEYYKSKYYKHL